MFCLVEIRCLERLISSLSTIVRRESFSIEEDGVPARAPTPKSVRGSRESGG